MNIKFLQLNLMRLQEAKVFDVKEIQKLRKNLDQQLVGFQDLITKLANKLQRQLLSKTK